jgi:transcriptional regulator with XRE-family HTH domain
VDDLTDVLKELIKDKGKQTEIAKKLGISAQRLGQYLAGRQKPKLDFYIKWKEVFGEDIQQMLTGETTNVSRGTLEEVKGRVYTELIEGKNINYILQHKNILSEYKMVPNEIIKMLGQVSQENTSIKQEYQKLVDELRTEIDELRGRRKPPAQSGGQ